MDGQRFLQLLFTAVILRETVCQEEKEVKKPAKDQNSSPVPWKEVIPEVNHVVPPALVDPLLCDQLRKGYEPEDATEAKRVSELLDLCAGKKPEKGSDQPPTENMTEADTQSRVKRDSAVKTLMSPENQKMVLDLHNKFRREVIPPAADMKFMKWDEYLADTAQMWSNKCDFKHGMPDDVIEKQLHLGQNLYIGRETTGKRAMEMWNDELEHYYYFINDCELGEECGHYKQLAWAESEYVGCGIAKCVRKGYLITCHYRPAGNAVDVLPYMAGKPCSQCAGSSDVNLCYENACATKTECEELKLNCSCNLECENCGTLLKQKCRCRCKTGWDSRDCSRKCADNHDSCNNNPGFPDVFACSFLDFQVRDYYCRKMCRQCESIHPDTTLKELNNTREYCCQGKLCEDGQVLNISSCECSVLCPGPACFPETDEHQLGDLDDFLDYLDVNITGDFEDEIGTETTQKAATKKSEDNTKKSQTPKVMTKLSIATRFSVCHLLLYVLVLIITIHGNS